MRRCLCYTKMSVAVKHKCRFIFYLLCKFFHAMNKKQRFWHTIKCKNRNGDLHRHAAFLLAGVARCVYAYILLHILRVVNKYFEFYAYFEYFLCS